MYVHRQRAELSKVRKVETQPTVGSKGRRSLAPGPRSPADGGHGSAGRDVQSIRHAPRRRDGSCDLVVMFFPSPEGRGCRTEFIPSAHMFRARLMILLLPVITQNYLPKNKHE